MPERSKNSKQRWNPGSASAALAEAAASSSSSTRIAKNPSAKNDTFVSEGSVKDRLSMWGATKETKTDNFIGGQTARKFIVEPPKATPTQKTVENPVALPSSSSHSTSSKKSALSLATSSNHSVESIKGLTGGSSHRERLAAWSEATQSMSRLCIHDVSQQKTQKAATKSTYLRNETTQTTVSAPAKANRATLVAQSRGAKSMSSLTTADVPSSTIPIDMPFGGLSVKDRMKSWGKAPVTTSATIKEPNTNETSAFSTAALSSETLLLQNSKSLPTHESLSKRTTGNDKESATSSAATLHRNNPTSKSPPPLYAHKALKKITPPQEDKHKHQCFSRIAMPSVDLKKVARPVEKNYKQTTEHFVGAVRPAIDLKKVASPNENDRQELKIGRPSLYAAASLRNVAKPQEDKWKQRPVAAEGRHSLYSSVSLRNVDLPEERQKKIDCEIASSKKVPSLSPKKPGVPTSDKRKENPEQKLPGEATASFASALTVNYSSNLESTITRTDSDTRNDEPSYAIFSSQELRNKGMTKEDKRNISKCTSHVETTFSGIRSDNGKGDATATYDVPVTPSASSSPTANPYMPTGEKTNETSPTINPLLASRILTSALSPHIEEQTISSKCAELMLEELPLESPTNAPKIPPSPLEVLVKESVVGGENKLIMLMSTMSGRQDQKTAQDRALTILRGLQVGPDKMELIDGADPRNKERRNQLFEISGIRAQYPQFFLVDRKGKMEFLGDWDSFEMMHDSGHLGESMNLGCRWD
ncbi:hypothetical protein IV203_023460 [Nitzschia inconspicua]|uniref:Uncharacterized protein n=1 Tax=Nitzschia inconspicua TaxID=303405 RepID=A0A9K3KEF8_9STRA|nr:hypothetical protein IV203_023460 [Nitzschia inconspicua]